MDAVVAEVTAAQAGLPRDVPISLPANQVISTGKGAAWFHKYGTGSYSLFFPGLVSNFNPPLKNGPLPGVVQIQNTGAAAAASGSCTPSNSQAWQGGVFMRVYCTNASHHSVDRPFTVMWTDGAATSGGLVTASIDSGTGKVLGHTSTVGGSVAAVRTGKGAYSVDLPYLPGTAPVSLQVSDASRVLPSAATCNIMSTAKVNAKTERVKVACTGPLEQGPTDDPIVISYARGTSTLGSPVASDAHATMPKLTANTTFTPALQVDRNYGDTSGKITLTRTGTGRYAVRLGHQGEGLGDGAAQLTALGSTASCHPVNNTTVKAGGRTDRIITVTCTNPLGQATDTAFNLQYLAGQ